MRFDEQLEAGEGLLALAEQLEQAAHSPSTALIEALLVNQFDEAAYSLALSPSGQPGIVPSATELFNAFVYPNHATRPRNALHRHYSQLFDVLASPGDALVTQAIFPGDWVIRIARGEGWGNVSIVVDGEWWRHDQLAAAGLRGEDFPRPAPGRYLHVVEILPRRRRREDRYARRVSDAQGRLRGDTLLLRPIYTPSRQRSPYAADVWNLREQVVPPAAPDSPVAGSFIAAHSSRYCTPGQAGSATCAPLTAPRAIRRVVIHVIAVPSTRTRSGVNAVIAGWQNSGRQASAHYLVDSNGAVTQMVREANVAFHTPGNNADSIGIEHADVCNDPAPLTQLLYEASAALVRDIARRNAFTINTATVAGHHQVNPNHEDPGIYWDWEYYYLLLAWNGVTAGSKPLRWVAAVTDLTAVPAGWQSQNRRAIANDRCANRHDPWGKTYWRAQPSASGVAAECSVTVTEVCTYKVSLWWPDVRGANPAAAVDIEVVCLSGLCLSNNQSVMVNQRPNSGKWNDVAVINVAQAPATVKVRWRRDSAQPGWILADAMRVLKISSCPIVAQSGSQRAETTGAVSYSDAAFDSSGVYGEKDRDRLSGEETRKEIKQLLAIHDALVKRGFSGLTRAGIDIDNVSDEERGTIVKAFQKRVWSDPDEWDGKMGVKTRAKLTALFSSPDQDDIVDPNKLESIMRSDQPNIGFFGAKVIDLIYRSEFEPLVRYRWPGIGKAPLGYLKGMALTWARMYCKWKQGDSTLRETAKAATRNVETDALAFLELDFNAVGWDNSRDGAETLANLFTLLWGVAIRESGGKYCMFRDTSSKTKSNLADSKTWEAGLFQMSYYLGVGSSKFPLIKAYYDQLKTLPYSGYLQVFSEGVKCPNFTFGTGDVETFRKFCVMQPALAAELAAFGLRSRRKHWGPVNKHTFTLNPDVKKLLFAIESLVDGCKDSDCCGLVASASSK